MKLPVTVWERVQYMGKYRMLWYGVSAVTISKVLYDSCSYIYDNWAWQCTLGTRRKRFDPVRIEENLKRRELEMREFEKAPQ
mmetsp:Transcript_35267/g.64506  ORF Transcript_35267/g.64506 Transcript_35267/m.64506 type:complete len:82 (+) Transcript_35267:78-323(+)